MWPPDFFPSPSFLPFPFLSSRARSAIFSGLAPAKLQQANSGLLPLPCHYLSLKHPFSIFPPYLSLSCSFSILDLGMAKPQLTSSDAQRLTCAWPTALEDAKMEGNDGLRVGKPWLLDMLLHSPASFDGQTRC